jgi:hypothetical protein
LWADAYLNGAFIVDPAGPVPADRVFVINAMFAEADVIHPDFEVVTINGKSYPYTEPLEYTAGEIIRWRVINPSISEHPMHLHGAFYRVLSLGTFETDTAYAGPDRQSVVTQNMQPGSTMMMEWTPEHAGRWLFHCHFQFHVSTDERVPVFSPVMAKQYGESEAKSGTHEHHDAMGAMNDMAGLVLMINVKASSSAPVPASTATPRKLDLVIEPNAAGGKTRTFSCSVREGKKIVASEEVGWPADRGDAWRTDGDHGGEPPRCTHHDPLAWPGTRQLLRRRDRRRHWQSDHARHSAGRELRGPLHAQSRWDVHLSHPRCRSEPTLRRSVRRPDRAGAGRVV